MKCPVCNEIIRKNITECLNCGFDQLYKEFINEHDYNIWFNETVLPCRKVFRYQENHSKKIEKLESQNKRLLKIINDILLILINKMTQISTYTIKLRSNISPSNKEQRNCLNEINYALQEIFRMMCYSIPQKYISNKRAKELSYLEGGFPTDDNWEPFDDMPF